MIDYSASAKRLRNVVESQFATRREHGVKIMAEAERRLYAPSQAFQLSGRWPSDGTEAAATDMAL
jgi:hypothetical protein